jgi:hypothetical protein
MSDNVITFPNAGALPKGERTIPIASEPDDESPKKVDWRSRENVLKDIRAHEAARDTYAKAVAWLAAAEAEGLSEACIEAARQDTAQFYAEMQESAYHLVVCMPTDPKALVDLLMYLEKHFSILPQEICGRSLAFELLKTVRLSLRRIAKYGKFVGSVAEHYE